MKTSAITLFAISVLAAAASAQNASRPAEATQNKPPAKALDGSEKKSEPKSDPKDPVVTEHDITINGQTIHYRATAGLMPLLDDYGKSKASIFYIAYEKLEQAADGTWKRVDPQSRPLTFSFNGGPGSSSVWLHMGTLGPRRVVFGDEGEALPPPAKLADNEHSWLDLTDIVFIDPVSTGFSRANEGENASQFHGLSEDATAVADFIRLWISRNDRWLSPKYLIGESYGTTRAAALSGELQDRLGIYLNGITLVSMVLNFQTLSFDNGNDTAYWLFLPTYTATAFHHKKLAPPLDADLEKTLAEARRFARDEYLPILARGDAISKEEREAFATKLAGFLGVSKDFVLRCDLRVPIGPFTKELLRDQSRTVGRLDSRYKGVDRSDATATFEYDPSMSAILGPYTAAVNAYVRGELNWESDVNYEILTGRVRPWKTQDGRYVDVSETLRASMSKNPSLKVWVANGYFDLATPFFASEYTVDHMGLDPMLRGNVSMTYYKGGHMMYVRKEDLAGIKKDAVRFYAK
jgi:carboxypeptidase C (cathepsin A)